jgi:hypothetical protein
MKDIISQQLVPRRGVYELYWHFVSERQAIFERRQRNEPPTWTDDPILAEYKFTNVFRAADRVSQYMIRRVCYGDAPTTRDRLFAIVAFRTFSNIAMWERLRAELRHAPTVHDLANGAFETALTKIKNDGQRLYTGAFILCANDAYGRRIKHLNHVEMFKSMFVTGDLCEQIINAKSLGAVYDALHGYPLMGDFMAYQTAIDINYSKLINFDENDFVKAGPGARRGIAKCFEDIGNLTPEQVIYWMVENQDRELARLGLNFDGLFGRKLHAIDVQNCFCETDKYCRQARPELASNRHKIKTRFKQNATPLDLFFPPKWKINDLATKTK